MEGISNTNDIETSSTGFDAPRMSDMGPPPGEIEVTMTVAVTSTAQYQDEGYYRVNNLPDCVHNMDNEDSMTSQT